MLYSSLHQKCVWLWDAACETDDEERYMSCNEGDTEYSWVNQHASTALASHHPDINVHYSVSFHNNTQKQQKSALAIKMHWQKTMEVKADRMPKLTQLSKTWKVYLNCNGETNYAEPQAETQQGEIN